MSLSTTTNRVSYAGNDVTTVFSFPYYFLEDADLTVILVVDSTGAQTTQTISTDYTVSGAGVQGGGTVTMNIAPASGETLVILRDVALTQGLDLRENDALPAEEVEKSLDRLTMATQRNRDLTDRSIVLPDGFTDSFSTELPADIDTADKALVTNSAGDGLALGPTIDEISNAQTSATAAANSATAASNSATAAANSATQAANNAAASQWSDVVYITNADSPVTIADDDTGTLYSVDSSGGAVSFTLPEISTLSSYAIWTVGIKKTDSSSNAITVNRSGTDTIDGATSKVIDRQYEGSNFVPDTDATPDDWTSLTFGEVPIDGAIVGTTDTQTLSNKKFSDAISFDQISTPANPASGDNKMYFKSDDKLYKLDASGNEIEIGAGGGGGGKNYMDGGDFESGTGPAGVYEEASAAFADGDGGTPATISVSTNSSTPLAGAADLAIAKAATDGSAEGVVFTSDTIDRADRGRALWISFEWDGSHADYTDGDYELVAYLVGDNAIATVYPVAGLNSDGTLPNQKTKILAYVQTTASTTSVRVCLHLESDSATGTANTCYIDEIKLSPDATVPGAFVTPWESFTPTGSWTANTTYTGYKRRVGDSMEIEISMSFSGAPTSGGLSIDIPGGESIDTNKLANNNRNNTFGLATYRNEGAATHYGAVGYVSATQVEPVFARSEGSSNPARYINVDHSNPFTVANTDSFYFKFSVPIEGWEASATVSTQETNIEPAKVTATMSGDQSVTSDSSPVKVNFDTASVDNAGIFSTANDRVEIKKTGRYHVIGRVQLDNVSSATSRIYVYVYVDGSEVARIKTGPGVTSDSVHEISTYVDVTSGQYIEIYVRGQDDGTYTIVDDQSQFQVQEQPNLSVFALLNDQGKIQTKTLSSDVTSDGAISDLTFSNLTIGNWYEVILNLDAATVSSDDEVLVLVTHDSSTIGIARYDNANDDNYRGGFSFVTKFKATATTLTFVASSATANSQILGCGTLSETHVILEELPPKQEFTGW